MFWGYAPESAVFLAPVSEDRSYGQRFQTGREEGGRERRPPKKSGGFLEFVVILLVAFLLVFGVVRPFVVEAFFIPSESMVPTLQVGDRVLVNKFIYRFTEPDRGDIIVFESPEGPDSEPEGLVGRVVNIFWEGSDDRPDLIKRVVGLPGDSVAVRNGNLFVNGERQNESYLNQQFPDQSFFPRTTVPENHVFVMGDNRANSRDSRFIGPIPEENIEGEAFLRFWPPGRIGLL